MTFVRTNGRRLAAVAVTVALAATGGTLTTLPATAAVPGATVQDRQDPRGTVLSFPLDADVVGAGPSGFLTKTRGSAPEIRWTRYEDGSSVVLPGRYALGGGTDLVVTGDKDTDYTSRKLTVHDLSASGSAPVEIDLDALGGYHLTGMAGRTLLLTRPGEKVWEQYTATIEAGVPKLERVFWGDSHDCYSGGDSWTGADSVLYQCWLGPSRIPARIVVDLTTGFGPAYLQLDGEYAQDGTVSSTHVAWRELRSAGKGIVAFERGKGGVERWFPDGNLDDPLYLVDGWVATGETAHIDEAYPPGRPTPTRRPFTLQSIETGEKSVALTAFSSAVIGPGGSLLVRGGTPERGEGLYRISPRPGGGRPTVELVASTGQTTVVTVTGSTVPTTLTGERLAGGVDFGWDVSRGDVAARIELKHLGSGQSLVRDVPVGDGAAGKPGRIGWRWDGQDVQGASWGPARSGAYEWRLTVGPDDGIGPAHVSTGRFTVTRPAAAHDYDDNGTADLLARSADGALWRLGTRTTAPGGSPVAAGSTRVGGGWQVYDRLEATGNIAGTAAADAVARDKSGVLWLYQGTGDRSRPFSAPTRIGGGWQVYEQIAAGGDVTGDGRSDLLATDKSGILWLYPGTGRATAPFAPRKRIGAGWGIYNELSATGNLAGGPAGDLLARDKAGVLWLYLGKGDGTFAAPTRIGAGWGGFTGLVGVGDANGDGRADLIATKAGAATFYAGTGSWKAPFKPGTKTNVLPSAGYGPVF
ncbi:FG-GAP repeat domain-containing protein [Streptomyces sp. NPDC059247]|uniref:FG-GAP repeat domain-containing protein n=1 Tax=Streptomyces sp. NPDC059247 TaxID=3346790 RepID=UPI0036C37D94